MDDALDRFLNAWIVFKITRPDDVDGNHEGIVLAHGGPEKPMQDTASKLFEKDPEARVAVPYCDVWR